MSSVIVTGNKRVQAVRGSAVEPARRFALQQRDTTAWRRFVDSLDADQRFLLEQPIALREWYDLRAYAAFIDAAASTLGADDPDGFLHRAGGFVFDDGVNTLYRAFFRIATPGFVIRGAAVLWRLLTGSLRDR